MLELKSLYNFITVAQERSITKAAYKLYISQPALTRQIHALEEECGTALFIRSRHGLTLTEEGLLLVKRAEQLLDFADKTLSELKGGSSELKGRIAVGMGLLHSCRRLIEAMGEFATTHPQVTFEVRTANADAIKLHIERGTLDVGLLLEPIDIELFDTCHFGCEHFAVFMRQDHPLASKDTICLGDLSGQNLILPSRHGVRQEIEKYLEGVKVGKINYSNLTSNGALMVVNGLGLFIAVDDGYSINPALGLERRSFDEPLRLNSTLAWRKGGVLSKAAAAFVDYLKEHQRDLSSIQ